MSTQTVGLLKILYNDFNSKIGTTVFTQLTANTLLGSCRHNFVLIIKFQNLLRAEFYTDAAAFAPFAVGQVFF